MNAKPWSLTTYAVYYFDREGEWQPTNEEHDSKVSAEKELKAMMADFPTAFIAKITREQMATAANSQCMTR